MSYRSKIGINILSTVLAAGILFYAVGCAKLSDVQNGSESYI